MDTVVPALEPRCVLLGNLFRDQLDRYGELETIADRWAAMVSALPRRYRARAQRRRSADRRSRPRARRGHLLRDRGPVAGDRRRCSTRRTPSTAATAAPRTSTRRSTSGTSASTPARRAAGGVPIRRSRRGTSSLHGTRSASFTLHVGEQAVAVQLPLPGLYNVYNALAAAALCGSLGFTPAQIADGLQHVSAAFGRSERIAVGDHELAVLLIKNPAGANEVLRTLRLEHDGLDLLGILNDRTADGRDVSWIWDADFELLTPVVRRVTCSGTRAAELALRLKYAGVDEDKLYVEHDLPAALDRALATASCRAAVRVADLHRVARAAGRARPSRPRRLVLGAGPPMTAASVIWHELECGSYAEDLALWRDLAARVRRPGARRRRRHRPGDARAGPPGARGHGVGPRRRAARPAGRRRRRPGRLDGRRRRPGLRAGDDVRPLHRADADDSAARRNV